MRHLRGAHRLLLRGRPRRGASHLRLPAPGVDIGSDCEIRCELHNVEESWVGREHQITALCSMAWEDLDSMYEHELDEDLFEEYDDCVKEAVDESDWEPPPNESTRFIVTIPANHKGRVVYGVERYIAEFETRTVLVCEVDGEEKRFALGHGYGRYERNFNIQVLEEDFEFCYGRIA